MIVRIRWIPVLCMALAAGVLLPGCFRRGPQLGTVTGTVTLDGAPLPNAQVEFQPTQGFPPSYGTTNGLGQYELKYTKDKLGAAVGSHVVRITTETTEVDSAGVETQVPQRVPEKYNFRSELVRRVKPGENVLDFHLTSEPEKEEPGAEEPQPEKPGEEKPKVEKPATPEAEASKLPAPAAEAQAAQAQPPDAEQAESEKPAQQETESQQPEAGQP